MNALPSGGRHHGMTEVQLLSCVQRRVIQVLSLFRLAWLVVLRVLRHLRRLWGMRQRSSRTRVCSEHLFGFLQAVVSDLRLTKDEKLPFLLVVQPTIHECSRKRWWSAIGSTNKCYKKKKQRDSTYVSIS